MYEQQCLKVAVAPKVGRLVQCGVDSLQLIMLIIF